MTYDAKARPSSPKKKDGGGKKCSHPAGNARLHKAEDKMKEIFKKEMEKLNSGTVKDRLHKVGIKLNGFEKRKVRTVCSKSSAPV